MKWRRAFPTDDPREQPAYPLAEAARYLKIARATLSGWVTGRPNHRSDSAARSGPLIRPASVKPPVLSFWNLIEGHVLWSLRTEHGVSLRDARKALRYAEDTLEVERLLLRRDLFTEGGRLFLERYGKLIDLSASGQLAMRQVFEQRLKRVEWDEWEFPVRLYPYVSGAAPTPSRPIVIDPERAFGRPVLHRQGISTRVIAERIDAGETVAELAQDYELKESEVEEAVLYERSA